MKRIMPKKDPRNKKESYSVTALKNRQVIAKLLIIERKLILVRLFDFSNT